MSNHTVATSVIIVTHNQSDILHLQITALENQLEVDIKDFEVVITDDSSSYEEFEKVKSTVKKTSLSCKLVSQKTDRYRASQARNNGIRVASGNLLIFLDGDMIPESNTLRLHIDTHKGNKKLLLAGNRIRRLVPNQIRSFDDLMRHCRNPDNTDIILSRRQVAEDKRRREYLNSSSPWRAMFSCHTSVSRSPGVSSEVLFDEKFVGWGPEDWEFAYRLSRQLDYMVKFAPHIVAYEVDSIGGGASNVFRYPTQQAIIDYLRNTLYFFDQCQELSLEEVCWGFRKLTLESDRWVVTEDKVSDLVTHVEMVREWLVKTVSKN